MTYRVEIPTAILRFSTTPNFYVIYHSSRNISISGLGGHIATSGCRSLSQSFADTFFDLDIVKELDFVSWITTILVLDLFCHISQHDHKISSIWKKITPVWRRAKQLPVHRLATWLLRFAHISYSGKVSKKVSK